MRMARIAEKVSNRVPVDLQDTRIVLKEFLTVMKEILADGGEVHMDNFAKIYVKPSKERQRFLPQKGFYVHKNQPELKILPSQNIRKMLSEVELPVESDLVREFDARFS